ncbi:MAG TPA: 1-acyl-sn-glycerol-3-phosphate acyltransferase [Syntrophomonadaceae bacterium]|nr:1-acyl-sn-glycerol-3-phosphate acyltransferase [Syntrophomonadaceae bacterium]
MFYNFCRSLFRFFFSVFCHWEVKGLENIPREGPLLIIANHISYWDPVVVGSVMSRKVYFMAKAELFNYPVFGALIRSLGAFPVSRKQVDRSSLKRALALLSEGKVVCIFPEGTRNKKDDLLPFLPGAAFIARKASVPIIPIALQKKRRFWGNKFFPHYIVNIGRSFIIEKEKQGDLKEDADKMRAKVRGLIDFSIN